jgi:hypothetical protein
LTRKRKKRKKTKESPTPTSPPSHERSYVFNWRYFARLQGDMGSRRTSNCRAVMRCRIK